MKLLTMFFVVLMANEVSAIPDPGCYRRNHRCTFGSPTTVPGVGNYRCPPGQRPWVFRENPLPRCLRGGNIPFPSRTEVPRVPDRRRYPDRLYLNRVERVLVEPVTIAIEVYVGGERIRQTIEGEASIPLTASDPHRGSARRRFSTLEDLHDYVLRVHCRSARSRSFPERGRMKLTYGNGSILWVEDAKVSRDASLKVRATYYKASRTGRGMRTAIVDCDKRRS